MSRLPLVYPKKQSIAFSNILFSLYHQAKTADCEEIVFDLSNSESLTPLGIIMLIATITECMTRGEKCVYRKPVDRTLQRFFKEIGFNKFFRLTDSDYSELHNISTGTIQLRRISGLNTSIADTITEIINFHLRISDGLKGSLRMSMNEAITNVIDHSGRNDYYVCCRTYPNLKQIRLCIADLGIGIRYSLTKKDVYKYITTDREAIKLATEEGVSSREERAGLGLSHIKKFLMVNRG